jgi:hypothetical protein
VERLGPGERRGRPDPEGQIAAAPRVNPGRADSEDDMLRPTDRPRRENPGPREAGGAFRRRPDGFSEASSRPPPSPADGFWEASSNRLPGRWTGFRRRHQDRLPAQRDILLDPLGAFRSPGAIEWFGEVVTTRFARVLVSTRPVMNPIGVSRLGEARSRMLDRAADLLIFAESGSRVPGWSHP